MSAAIIARPETPKMSEATTDSLICILQQFLHPVLLPAQLTDQVDAVSGKGTQQPDRRGRHETRPHYAPLRDLAQPHRVQLVFGRPGRC